MTIGPAAQPDSVFIWNVAGSESHVAAPDGPGAWSFEEHTVQMRDDASGTRVEISSAGGLSVVALRWRRSAPREESIFGDAWERSYGELGWQPLRAERVLPWYWLGHSSEGFRGAGVKVRPGAMCSWSVDSDGYTLWLDVRAGHEPVLLQGRQLHAATIVALEAERQLPAFDVQKMLTSALCTDALVPRHPLVGSNNWYYAYGQDFDLDAVLGDAAMIAQAAQGHDVAPLCVIDAGWSKGTSGAPGGPWDQGAGSFERMDLVADRIRSEGARPGLWVRPLLTSQRSGLTRDVMLDGEWPMDPSRDDVLEQVRSDVSRLAGWGYELIKHDFTSFDTLGHFIPTGDLGMASVPWTFADRSRTTAEVIIRLYQVILDAAGSAEILGCNTFGHLAAGLVHAQRTGDDTSGRQWERTRRMGVNTLAFRLAQHNSFFTLDADCVASTPSTPWDKNRQFLDLVAASGTALFVSVDPTTRNPEVDSAVRNAVQMALSGGIPGGVEALDQYETSTPERWRVGSEEQRFAWQMPWGTDQTLASI
jgi:alpha-galactosidase